jgi:nitrate/TMAO reductase-like tetraheme cytochrome c subunit
MKIWRGVHCRCKAFGHWLWCRPRRWFLFGIPAGGFLAFAIGAGFWISFDATIKATNTMGFCTSCHAMATFVYPDYQNSSHYNNRSGVRVECADCHVPRAFFPKMSRKIQASLVELPGHFLGRINTQEKFDAHKLVMAERVWAGMRATDSRECRACHSYEAMSASLQNRQAQRRHSLDYREATGRTCIDCHQGIAHKLPELPD